MSPIDQFTASSDTQLTSKLVLLNGYHYFIEYAPYVYNNTLICNRLPATVIILNSHCTVLLAVSYPPPINVSAQCINNHQINFTWNEPDTNCSAIHYNIISQNCGTCPNKTVSSTASCSDVAANQTAITCSFAVQTVVCGNMTGNESIGNYTEVTVEGELIVTLS